MKRNDYLDTAKELINGNRAKDYGDAKDNFDRIATGWNVIVQDAFTTHNKITAKHVALMMDWVKTKDRSFHDVRTYKELGEFVGRQGDWIFDDEAFLCQTDDGECTG